MLLLVLLLVLLLLLLLLLFELDSGGVTNDVDGVDDREDAGDDRPRSPVDVVVVADAMLKPLCCPTGADDETNSLISFSY